tara:strand:+ start:190 stop:438 length:249 start_codon:yes stop_codon:yes gene_type:complete
MSEEVKKIGKEEHESILEFQQKIRVILTNIGVLESQKHAALHDLAGVNQDQEKVKQEIEKKYGAININLEDGSYTEIEENVE